MLSFYQAYQAYERRWMRGELDYRLPPVGKLPWRAALALHIASFLLRAGHALYRQYARAIPPVPPYSQEQS